MTFFKNRSAFVWSLTCMICVVMTLLLTSLTDRMNMSYQRLTENLFKLHPDTLKDTSLKYQSLVNEVYAERVLHLRQTCRNSSSEYLGDSTDKDVANNIHIEQNHNLVYCQIQKVGSTFIRSLLKRLFQSSVIEQSETGFKRLKDRTDLGFAELHSVIQNSDKFMFVRDPYTRVLSGYVDKLFCPNTLYWRVTGKYVVSQIRKNANQLSLSCGHDVTFPEFVQYIIQSEKGGTHTDRHFTPLYEHCRPCQIPYDFIGKFETFKDDILFLLNVWNKGYGTNITFDDFESETAAQRAESQGKLLFGMRKQLENCMTFYNASLRSWRDLQIRGILPIKESFPFSAEFTEHHMTNTDFISAAKKAIDSESDSKAVKAQRDEAFVEAFSLVPMDDLYKLQKVLEPDCNLFNYDSRPPKIFERQDGNQKNLKYFDTL